MSTKDWFEVLKEIDKHADPPNLIHLNVALLKTVIALKQTIDTIDSRVRALEKTVSQLENTVKLWAETEL